MRPRVRGRFDGPWVDDSGRVWDGDPQLTDLSTRLFSAVQENTRCNQRLAALRRAMAAIVDDPNASPSGVLLAVSALEADQRLTEPLDVPSPAEQETAHG
jgi:hypothetical protein